MKPANCHGKLDSNVVAQNHQYGPSSPSQQLQKRSNNSKSDPSTPKAIQASPKSRLTQVNVQWIPVKHEIKEFALEVSLRIGKQDAYLKQSAQVDLSQAFSQKTDNGKRCQSRTVPKTIHQLRFSNWRPQAPWKLNERIEMLETGN